MKPTTGVLGQARPGHNLTARHTTGVGVSGSTLIYKTTSIPLFYDALDAPTDAQVEFKSTCKLTGDGETDTVWFDADLPGGQRGQVFCEDFDNNLCDQFYVTLDPTELNIGSNDEADTTKTSCHELGHSVGLSHGAGGGNGGADDCMMSGERPNLNSQYERYSLHHKEHINDWF